MQIPRQTIIHDATRSRPLGHRSRDPAARRAERLHHLAAVPARPVRRVHRAHLLRAGHGLRRRGLPRRACRGDARAGPPSGARPAAAGGGARRPAQTGGGGQSGLAVDRRRRARRQRHRRRARRGENQDLRPDGGQPGIDRPAQRQTERRDRGSARSGRRRPRRARRFAADRALRVERDGKDRLAARRPHRGRRAGPGVDSSRCRCSPSRP